MAFVMAAGMVWLVSHGSANSQQAQAPAPKEPYRVQTPQRVVPIAVGFEDPEELRVQLEEMRLRQRDGRQPAVAEAEEDADETVGRRLFEIEAPRVENVAPEFRFRDATVREGGHARLPKLTMQQRQAMVEAYRRSLVKKNDGR